MVQVLGSTQNVNNANHFVNEEREWISVEEQERRFRVHKTTDVYLGFPNKINVYHELFELRVLGIIADYAKMDDNWLKACKLLGEDVVPAFPEEHMSEIGDQDSVFYLTPAGSLNQFEARLSRFAYEVLGIQGEHPLKFRIFQSDVRLEHGDTPHGPKWASMERELLEGTQSGTTTHEQDVENLATKKGVPVPSFQTVAKILFLDRALQLATLKRAEAEEAKDDLEAVQAEKTLFPVGTFTRAIETIDVWNVAIGVDSLGVVVLDDYYNGYDDDYGLAVVREF